MCQYLHHIAHMEFWSLFTRKLAPAGPRTPSHLMSSNRKFTPFTFGTATVVDSEVVGILVSRRSEGDTPFGPRWPIERPSLLELLRSADDGRHFHCLGLARVTNYLCVGWTGSSSSQLLVIRNRRTLMNACHAKLELINVHARRHFMLKITIFCVYVHEKLDPSYTFSIQFFCRKI